MLKVNTRRRCKICSNLTLKTPERHHYRHFDVFIVNFEHIFTPSSSVFIVEFEQVMFAEIVWYFSSFSSFNKNFKMCFSNILHIFQPIQDRSPFQTETNQFDL